MATRRNLIERQTTDQTVTSAVRTQDDGSVHLTLVVSCAAEFGFEVLYRPRDGGAAVVVYDEETNGDDLAPLPAGAHVRRMPGNIGDYQVRLTPSASGELWADTHET